MEPKNTNPEAGNTLYEFTTLECRNHKRGKTWFIGMGTIVILVVLWGIFSQSISLILLAILLGGVYTITHNKQSSPITVSFSDIGLTWNTKFFQYQTIKTFWIIWKPGKVQSLHIILSSGLQREIIIPIEGQDVGKIRDILGYYIPETEGRSERMSDWLIRKLKL